MENHTVGHDQFRRPVQFAQFLSERQLSPRVNVVFQLTDTTTLTAGYSRYFVPPPFELIAAPTISLFAKTTAAPTVTLGSTPKAERDHYFDVGGTQIILPGLTRQIPIDGQPLTTFRGFVFRRLSDAGPILAQSLAPDRHPKPFTKPAIRIRRWRLTRCHAVEISSPNQRSKRRQFNLFGTTGDI
jgi:hypothetical protein